MAEKSKTNQNPGKRTRLRVKTDLILKVMLAVSFTMLIQSSFTRPEQLAIWAGLTVTLSTLLTKTPIKIARIFKPKTTK